MDPHVSPRCVLRDYLLIYGKKTTISTQLMFSELPKKKREKICRPQKVHRHRWWQKPVLPPLHGHLSPKSGVKLSNQKKICESWCEGWSECRGSCCCGGGGVRVFKGLEKMPFAIVCVASGSLFGPQKSTNINHIKQPSNSFRLPLKNGFSMFPMRCETKWL